MYVLVTYDVSTTSIEGRRRLRKAAKVCLDYGQRVQNSVFELLVNFAQWTQCKNQLLEIIDPAEDSLRFYYLGEELAAQGRAHWGEAERGHGGPHDRMRDIADRERTHESREYRDRRKLLL